MLSNICQNFDISKISLKIFMLDIGFCSTKIFEKFCWHLNFGKYQKAIDLDMNKGNIIMSKPFVKLSINTAKLCIDKKMLTLAKFVGLGAQIEHFSNVYMLRYHMSLRQHDKF